MDYVGRPRQASTNKPSSSLRRPAVERIEANKSWAISYAAYQVLVDLFPSRASTYLNWDATHVGAYFNGTATT